MATKTPENPDRLKKLPLSVKLGVANGTLHKHLMKPDAPKPDADGTYDVEEVREYLAKESNAGTEGSEIRDLRANKLRMETETMEFELRRKRGETITKSEIAPAIAAFNAELTANLRQKFEIELPQKYRGKGTVECQQLNAAAIDFILERLKAGQWALGIPKESR